MTGRPASPGAAGALEVIVFQASVDFAAGDSLDEAWALLEAASGYCGHQFGQCVEEPGQYMLLIWWRHINDHLLTFRHSAAHSRWKQLIDAHVDSVSSVRHFTLAG